MSDEVAEKPKPALRNPMVTFPYERKGRDPRRPNSIAISSIEITDAAGPPMVTDSSIVKLPSKEASLSRSNAGVTLKFGPNEHFWGYGRLDEVVNVPWVPNK